MGIVANHGRSGSYASRAQRGDVTMFDGPLSVLLWGGIDWLFCWGPVAGCLLRRLSHTCTTL